MIKKMMRISTAMLIGSLLAAGVAYAAPITLSDAQLDGVAAGAFLCTVNLHGDGLLNAMDHRSDTAGLHVGIGTPSGYDVDGNYVEYVTVAPAGAQNLTVPVQATNTGSPTDGFSAPGQSTYTAIWH